MLKPEDESVRQFRAEVRDWLAENLDPDIRFLTFRPLPPIAIAWHRKLAARGWIAPHWPRIHGGMEATPVEQLVLTEELARAGAPDIPLQGLLHIGPLLIKFGTEAQKRMHLPKILSGEITWAQGYSEPNSGSDLATLRSKGRIDGGEIIINGQKTWTTWGQHAEWMFALVRTREGTAKRDGITFVMFDMNTPGITRRPIVNIAGDIEFCEVFFDDVRVPLENVVGKDGEGWSVAMALLDDERIRGGGPMLALKALSRVRAIIAANDLVDNPLAMDHLARAEVETAALCAAYLDSMEKLEQGKSDGRDSCYLKILATETTQLILDIAQELAGSERAVKRTRRGNGAVIDFSEMFLQSRRLTIMGGTSEIQRTLLATRALGLPKGAG